jgi:hypothetical protein
VRLHDRRVQAAQFGARRLDAAPWRETAEQLRHPVLAAGHHRRRQVMRAGHDVRDQLGFRRVRHRRFEHADDRRGARSETDRLAENARAARQRRPETVGQHGRAGRIRAVVAGVEQPPENRPEPHHLEVAAIDDSGPDGARIAKTVHRETDRRELAQACQGSDAGPKVANLGHRERGVFDGCSRRTLADVEQPALVLVHERAQQHAPHHAEDRVVGADAQRQRQHDGQRQSLRVGEGAERELQIGEKGHKRLRGLSARNYYRPFRCRGRKIAVNNGVKGYCFSGYRPTVKLRLKPTRKPESRCAANLH